MTETIVFYRPKSTLASVLGVLGKYVFLGLPFLAYWLLAWDLLVPIWVGLLICVVIGIGLMVVSDGIVAPLVGRRTEFTFSETQVKIQSPSGLETLLLTDLKSLRVFEVEGELSVKHVLLECQDGRSLDIFETWVTSETIAAFERVYRRYEGAGIAGL